MVSKWFVDYFGDYGCCCCKRFHDADMQTDPEILRRLPLYIQKGKHESLSARRSREQQEEEERRRRQRTM
jgi:hypothetical protein